VGGGLEWVEGRRGVGVCVVVVWRSGGGEGKWKVVWVSGCVKKRIFLNNLPEKVITFFSRIFPFPNHFWVWVRKK